MLLVALLTALISVNGAVAALLPVVVVMAVRLGRSPSQLLLPLAFAAHAGSLLVLTGTPVNVIVSEAADDAGVGELRLLRVRARRRAAPDRDDRDRRPASASGCCRTRSPRVAPARLQRPRAHARRAVRARARRRTTLLHAQAGRRRGRDPAALERDRRDRLPGHGHRQRRPRRSSPCSARARSSGPGETVLAVGRHAAPARHVGRARREPRRSGRARRRRTRRSCAGRRCRSGRGRSARSSCSRRWSSLLATGAVPPAVAGLLAAGAIVLLRVLTRRAVLPRDLVDDRDPRRRDDPALDGDARDRRGRQARRRARARSSATPAPLRAAARPLRAHGRARPADQQHGDGADRDPGRDLGRGRHGRLGEAGADVRHRGRGRLVPDARSRRRPT